MKLFIGDLSREDAEVLEHYGTDNFVLEFGCGGSTQIFAQVADFVYSVDTMYSWIVETSSMLCEFSRNYNVKFRTLIDFYENIERNKIPIKFDVIYIDGEWSKRLEFAKNTWHLLKDGGVMLFHDTRRDKDKRNVNEFIKWTKQGVFVTWNENESNITSIVKDDAILTQVNYNYNLPYMNWNKAEKKEDWMANAMLPRPEDWKELLIEKLGINDSKRKSDGVSR